MGEGYAVTPVFLSITFVQQQPNRHVIWLPRPWRAATIRVCTSQEAF